MLRQESKNWPQFRQWMKSFVNKSRNSCQTPRQHRLRRTTHYKTADGPDFRRMVTGRIERVTRGHLSILLTPAAIFRTRERKNERALTYLQPDDVRVRSACAFMFHHRVLLGQGDIFSEFKTLKIWFHVRGACQSILHIKKSRCNDKILKSCSI